MKRNLLCGALIAGAILATNAARAQCPPIDFEDLAVGTAVTTQYPGVAISVLPQSCGGSPNLYMRIATATGGTSSGTKALRIDTGCPDFSPDYLRMRFDFLQREVRFTVGEATGAAGYDLDVRYYSDASLLGTLHVETGSGVNRMVRVGSSGGPQIIRRIEVDSTIDAFEVIDDLQFGGDPTPPQAQIDTPAYEACICGSVSVRGIACDSDGDYSGDTLEYLRVDAAPGSAWTLIGSASTPVCASNVLYSWNTTGLAHGKYYLRLTVANECGLRASDVVVVYLDRQFDSLQIRFPAEGQVVGETVCIDGTAWDQLCFDQYTVDYQPAGGGAWAPVNAASPTYETVVTNDPLASWDTKGLSLLDGSYRLRVAAIDSCGNPATLSRLVSVDNTPPVAVITAPHACGELDGSVQVRGTVTDAHLAGWTLQYSGDGQDEWITISSGSTPVNNNVLGTWNVEGLPPCAYALRLVATDTAVLNCNSSLSNRTETIVTVAIRPCVGDFDGNGSIDIQDLALLLSRFGLICP